ncbi:FG-GAP repeat domain-containing protein [Arthrobacter sp. D1-17]
MKKTVRWLSHIVVLSLVVAGGLLGVNSAAQAATVGTPSLTYSGVQNPPTADKPQSKLWWNDGSWWASMWKTGSGWSIYRLNRGTATWVDTGVRTDPRASTSSDTLWDGTHLYIAHNVVTTGNSASGQPARLFRYSYFGGKYTLSSGFPVAISNNSSESLSIAKDSKGAIWATWTQVSGSTSRVYVNHSLPGGAGWGRPFVVPAAQDPSPTPDDLSAIVAYDGDEIGIMWTDQATGTAWWATHEDDESPRSASSWKVKQAIKGNKRVDDHLNIKTLQADASGRVFAAVKTSLDDGSSDPALAQLLLVVFKPATGSFSQTTIARTGDCVSRPQIMLDTANNLVRAFYTAPSTSVRGCAFPGVAGSIYEKTASMDNPVFGSGRGKAVIEDAASPHMNNVTSSKQSVNATTGIVVMASNHVTKRYWFSDRRLGTTSAPAGPAPVNSIGAADTVAAGADGVLWSYRSNGRGGLQPRIKIGSGWTGLKNGFTTDWNQDGVFDLVAQWKDGRLSYHQGNPAGGFAPGQVIGSGWGGYHVTVGRWRKADRYPGVVAYDAAGALWHYPNRTGKTLGSRTRIGNGWNGLYITMADYDRDGSQDLLVKRNDGAMLLYRSNGTGTFHPGPRPSTGGNWSGINSVTKVEGFRGSGTHGLIARLTDGRLAYYPMRNGTWGTRVLLSGGWGPYSIFR